MRFLNNKNSLLIKFMISYILIMSFMLLIGVFGYVEASKIVENDIKQANLSMLNQSKDIVDQKISVLGTAAMQIATNRTITKPLNISEDAPDFSYVDIQNVSNQLATYKLNLDNDFIHDYYVYIKKSNYLITPDTVYKSDFYFNHVLKNTDMNISDWNKILNDVHHQDFFHSTFMEFDNGKKTSIIMYMESLPFDFNKNYNGTFVVLIYKNSLDKIFSRIDISKGGWIYIQDDHGKIINTISKDNKNIKYLNIKNDKSQNGYFKQAVNGENMIISYTKSNVTGWKYVLVLPDNIVMNKLNNFKRFIIIIFVASLIIGIIIAYYMAYRNSKPVNKILEQIKETIGYDESKNLDDAFNTINNTISSLLNSNKDLNEKIISQKPILLSAIIDRLLKGEFSSLNEVIANTSYIGLNIESHQYLVLVLSIFERNDIDEVNKEIVHELNAIKVLLIETFNKYLDNKALYHDLDPKNMAVILYCDNGENYREKVTSIIEDISNEFVEKYSLKMMFGIGTVYSSILEVWRSFQEALETSNYIQLHKDEKIKWFSDIPKETQTYYYPMEIEQNIINYVKSGDLDQIINLLNIIMDENIKKRKLSPVMSKQLFYEIKGTLLKLIQQTPEDEKLLEDAKNIQYEKSIMDSFNNLFDIYKHLCVVVSEHKNSRNLSIINKIVKFIKNNYANQNLSLTLVASEFHFSEGYLCNFFKEQTGQNFTEFVEQVRMEEACTLLKYTEINIDEIADKVGYNSVHSFRRAFKRIKGFSPSTMRK